MSNSNKMPEGYKFKDGALWFQNKDNWQQLTINSKIKVTANVHSPDSNNWGKSISLLDPNGKKHEFVILNSDLSNGGKNTIRTIADNGLMLFPGAEKKVIEYLSLSMPEKTNVRAISTGWPC